MPEIKERKRKSRDNTKIIVCGLENTRRAEDE
jgi:hypothetical protein